MHLRELKQKSMAELVSMAKEMAVEGVAGMRKQDAIFAILTHVADKDGNIHGDGVLECLPDGFGFLRAADYNYLPGPDDVYVSKTQIRRFNLRTGDHVQGTTRPPKETERYFALIKVDKINGEAPEIARDKILFDNLTPLYPQKKFDLELSTKTNGTGTGWLTAWQKCPHTSALTSSSGPMDPLLYPLLYKLWIYRKCCRRYRRTNETVKSYVITIPSCINSPPFSLLLSFLFSSLSFKQAIPSQQASLLLHSYKLRCNRSLL